MSDELKNTGERGRRLSIVLIIVAGVLAVDVVYQMARAVQWQVWLARVAAASDPVTTRPADTQSATRPTAQGGPKKPPEVSEAIKHRNVFVKPQPKGHGLSLVGVLIDTALFQTREGQVVGLRAGESGHGVKVTAIDGYEVTIEHEGKAETMALHQTGPGRGRPPMPPGGPRPGPMPRPGARHRVIRR